MITTEEKGTPLGGGWRITAEALIELYKVVDRPRLGTTKTEIARNLNIARPTLDRYLRERPTLEPLAKSLIRAKNKTESP